MRPPNKLKIDRDRSSRIGAAITRVGPARLTTVHGVTSWAIYKWRNKGFVPNEHLKLFCRETGESPNEVCDPSIADLVKSRIPNPNANHTTKSR